MLGEGCLEAIDVVVALLSPAVHRGIGGTGHLERGDRRFRVEDTRLLALSGLSEAMLGRLAAAVPVVDHDVDAIAWLRGHPALLSIHGASAPAAPVPPGEAQRRTEVAAEARRVAQRACLDPRAQPGPQRGKRRGCRTPSPPRARHRPRHPAPPSRRGRRCSDGSSSGARRRSRRARSPSARPSTAPRRWSGRRNRETGPARYRCRCIRR